MAAAAWLCVVGYLMVAIAELLPVRFRSNRDDTLSHFHVCWVALLYGLSWPGRLLRQAREE